MFEFVYKWKIVIETKLKCEDIKITSIKTSNELYLQWKKLWHKNLLYFRIYADFEADNEKGKSSLGSKTTTLYKQNPVLNGYHIKSELEDILKNGYHKSPLSYNNVDWFVGEVIKWENKMTFYFKNTNKDIIMTKEEEENFENNNICRLCEKFVGTHKVRDHCHLTGKYRGPAHKTFNNNVRQEQSDFIPIIFHNFSIYDCHMFFKNLVDEEK